MKSLLALARAATLATAAVAAAVSVATSAAAQARKFDNVTLRVATFPGSWIDRIKAEVGVPLEKDGIKLEFVPGNSAEFLAKLVAARGQEPPFDVAEIADETYEDFRRAGFLAKLDLANIPNVKDLDKQLYDEHRVANWASEPSIVYNVDKFKAAGIAPPKRFSDLADPRLKGRVLVADVGVYIFYYQITALAYENGGSEKAPDAGFEQIRKIQPHSATTAIGTVAQLFTTGDVWAAIWPAHIAFRLADAGHNVAAVHPVIKGKKLALARGYVAVVNGTKVQRAAEHYINAILAHPVQRRFYTESGLVPVNRTTLLDVKDATKKDRSGVPFVLLEPADLAQAWWPDYAVIDKRDWGRRWQRAIAR